MNRATTDHPQVTAYLRRLDAALAVVPAGPARELREQITGHLDEALPPGASDQEVAGALARLGRPADLAAEAVATAGKRSWLARVGWRRWSLIAVAVILLGGLAGYLAPSLTAGPLDNQGGLSSWWYARDASRQVITSADDVSQTAVPYRRGQWQGFLVQVFNDTSQPQTVLGAAPGTSFNNSPYHMGMETEDPDFPLPSFRTLHFRLPVTIPPHKSRLLRVLWISPNTCEPKGGLTGIDQVSLRVRVGLFTRTENLSLDQGWYLAGHGSCGY
jgi:hypothetical protein